MYTYTCKTRRGIGREREGERGLILCIFNYVQSCEQDSEKAFSLCVSMYIDIKYYMYICVSVHVHACVCLSVQSRERERESGVMCI